MSLSCPIIFRQIDATVSKISTVIAIAFLGSYFLTMWVPFLVFLIMDLTVRLSGYKEYSPIYTAAQCIQGALDLPTRMEDAGGKRLAAFFGLIFILGILIAHFLGLWYVQIAIAAFFLTCALPDILFNYCIACKIYTCTKRIYPKAFN